MYCLFVSFLEHFCPHNIGAFYIMYVELAHWCVVIDIPLLTFSHASIRLCGGPLSAQTHSKSGMHYRLGALFYFLSRPTLAGFIDASCSIPLVLCLNSIFLVLSHPSFLWAFGLVACESCKILVSNLLPNQCTKMPLSIHHCGHWLIVIYLNGPIYMQYTYISLLYNIDLHDYDITIIDDNNTKTSLMFNTCDILVFTF